MRNRPLNLDKYGIDRDRYLELKYFCRQYGKWKRRINELHAAYSPINLTGMPSGSGTSDPVAKAALEAAELSHNCDMIETCAKQADNGLYEAIMKNVTMGIRYEDMPVCAGRRQFYERRRKFFWLLSQVKKGN